MSRTRPGLGTILIGLGVLSVAGCTGGSDSDPSTAATSIAPVAPATIPAGFTVTTGAGYQFGLPTAVNFVADSTQSTDNGLVKRWRYAVTPKGPFCVVVTTEQANFDGQFPESVVQLFAANTQPDQQTVRNEVMRPNPPGTIGGVDQESTFTGKLDDGTTFRSHLYQRKYLTPKRSLIALTVGGPEANSAQCQYAAIIKTFSVISDPAVSG